ncbi:UNVERIFIED_CONTAM: hypothetical protein RMT77_001816 [Armadillidium vulgare]
MMFGIVVIFSCFVTFVVSDQFEVRYDDESRDLHHHYEARKAKQLPLGEVAQKCGKECNTKIIVEPPKVTILPAAVKCAMECFKKEGYGLEFTG